MKGQESSNHPILKKNHKYFNIKSSDLSPPPGLLLHHWHNVPSHPLLREGRLPKQLADCGWSPLFSLNWYILMWPMSLYWNLFEVMIYLKGSGSDRKLYDHLLLRHSLHVHWRTHANHCQVTFFILFGQTCQTCQPLPGQLYSLSFGRCLHLVILTFFIWWKMLRPPDCFLKLFWPGRLGWGPHHWSQRWFRTKIIARNYHCSLGHHWTSYPCFFLT